MPAPTITLLETRIRLEWLPKRTPDGDVILELTAFDIDHEKQLAAAGVPPREQRVRATRLRVELDLDAFAHLQVTQGVALQRWAHERDLLLSDLRLGLERDADHTDRFRARASRRSERVCRCMPAQVITGLHQPDCFLAEPPPAAPGTPEAA